MRSFLTIALASLMLPASLQAEDRPATGARIALISEAAAIAPGEPFRVGIKITHAEGYHSYWKNPGIVGFATSVKWQLPEGFAAGEIAWPAPEIVDMAGHRAHGYHRDIVLTVIITPPDKITNNEVELEAKIAWMACSDACYPGDKNFSISLPVEEKTRLDDAMVPLFAKSDAEVPKPLEDWKAELLSKPDAPIIQLKLIPDDSSSSPLEDPYFFSLDGQLASEKPKVVLNNDGTEVLEFKRSQYSPEGLKGLPGVLRYQIGGKTFFAEVTPKP